MSIIYFCNIWYSQCDTIYVPVSLTLNSRSCLGMYRKAGWPSGLTYERTKLQRWQLQGPLFCRDLLTIKTLFTIKLSIKGWSLLMNQCLVNDYVGCINKFPLVKIKDRGYVDQLIQLNPLTLEWTVRKIPLRLIPTPLRDGACICIPNRSLSRHCINTANFQSGHHYQTKTK